MALRIYSPVQVNSNRLWTAFMIARCVVFRDWQPKSQTVAPSLNYSMSLNIE